MFIRTYISSYCLLVNGICCKWYLMLKVYKYTCTTKYIDKCWCYGTVFVSRASNEAFQVLQTKMLSGSQSHLDVESGVAYKRRPCKLDKRINRSCGEMEIDPKIMPNIHEP